MNGKSPASVVILTFNEERNIGYCLENIFDWCAEIFIVDSRSTDNTVGVASRYTDKIFVHEYVDHASQWNWALSNLPFRFDWVMALDADHIVTPQLKSQIIKVLEHGHVDVNGYYSRHSYYFFNTRMRGFKPYSLRLFRRSKTKVDRSELVDFRFIVEGRTEKLSGNVDEINRNELSIDFWIDKHQKFSTRTAAEEILRANGLLSWSITPRLFGNPDERIVWAKNVWYGLPLYFRPFVYFLYRYFLRLGFLDGKNGLVYHFLQAFWFRFLVDIKIAALRRDISVGRTTPAELGKLFKHSF
jgi:glycosyltransferase involved in cell wall biosynthesis